MVAVAVVVVVVAAAVVIVVAHDGFVAAITAHSCTYCEACGVGIRPSKLRAGYDVPVAFATVGGRLI